jgi:hypothetical protein
MRAFHWVLLSTDPSVDDQSTLAGKPAHVYRAGASARVTRARPRPYRVILGWRGMISRRGAWKSWQVDIRDARAAEAATKLAGVERVSINA